MSSTSTTSTGRSRPKTKIGMVLDQPFPPDARVEREAVALVEAGYEVHLLCSMPEGATAFPREEVYRGIHIHRVRPEEVTFLIPLLNIRTRLPYQGLIKNMFRTFRNIDTAWQTLIERFVRRNGIQVLHIHDLRLVDTGLSIAHRYGLPLVADLHENYPALISMLKGRKNPKRGQKERERWEDIERRNATEATQIITVIEEAKERLMLKGVPANKITVLPNTVDVEKFETVIADPKVIRKYKPYFLLTYVGHINGPHRGIHTVLEAMSLLKDDIPELHFVGAGAVREDYGAMLEQMIQRYGLQNRVSFTGWLDETEFASYISVSDICLCPHLENDHTNSTFPNKVYLYNLFAKPILSSACIPLKRYVEESQGGVTFMPGDARDLATKIAQLYNNPDLRRTLGENGQQAVLSTFNWRKTSRRLVDLYCQMIGAPPSRTLPPKMTTTSATASHFSS